jgi:hypothetical protein
MAAVLAKYKVLTALHKFYQAQVRKKGDEKVHGETCMWKTCTLTCIHSVPSHQQVLLCMWACPAGATVRQAVVRQVQQYMDAGSGGQHPCLNMSRSPACCWSPGQLCADSCR